MSAPENREGAPKGAKAAHAGRRNGRLLGSELQRLHYLEITNSLPLSAVSYSDHPYDRDDAGERAAAKLSARLMAEGMECWRIQFPKGMDANEYAQKMQPAGDVEAHSARRALGLLIRKAQWLGGANGASEPTRQTVPTEVAA